MLKQIILGATTIFFVGASASAQLNVDSRAIYDRMDRLERDITFIQRRLYKTDDASLQNPSLATNVPDFSVQGLYTKMSELEALVAQMTGQIEELSFKLEQTQEKLQKMDLDIDYRFSEFQSFQKQEKEVSSDLVDAATKVDKEEHQKPMDANTAYNQAYDFLKQLKYQEAEKALQDFLKTYPEHELAGNAQYWLGETYYVRHQYEQAAIAFATGFKNYKNSSKGVDNLLKLGLSMQHLNKKKEACTAFKNLEKEFPKASEFILSRAKKEQENLGCNK